MIVLLAPDKFRGSLTAREAGEAMAAGVLRARPDTDVVIQPVADGGEGTVEAFLDRGWRGQPVRVQGPTGEPHDVQVARSASGDAVVELAACCGAPALTRRSAPREATSRGAGDAVAQVLRDGARHVLIGLGGSVSTDGGMGFLAALGVVLRDSSGRRLPPEPRSLHDVAVVDTMHLLPQLSGAVLTFAVDVDNPLTGANGAAAVFGPQKGASPADVDWLAAGLDRWATVLGAGVGRLPGGGAAGGVAAGVTGALHGVADVRIVSGAATLISVLGVDELVQSSDLVVTGEGCFDRQSLAGKAPIEVIRVASASATPCAVVAGRSTLGQPELAGLDLIQCVSLTDEARDGEDSMRDAWQLVTRATNDIVREFVAPPGARRS